MHLRTLLLLALLPAVLLSAPPPKAKPVGGLRTAELKFADFPSMEKLAARLPKELAKPPLALHLSALATAYKDALRGVTISDDKKQLFIVGNDGSKHLYDDYRKKTAEQLMGEADIQDMFFWNYPLKNPTDRLEVDFDPGRARAEGFFHMLYGQTPEAVKKNLVEVPFAGTRVPFSRLYGASAALEKVGKELDGIVKTKPELGKWLTTLGGTWNWRKIAGTERLSTHSFGIAIDLNVANSKYWRWDKPETLATFSRLQFPTEIIEAFERHGFVWGGKWYHYDTMHFEFRPEILHVSHRSGKNEPPKAALTVAEPAIPKMPEQPKPAVPVQGHARRALIVDPIATDQKPRSSAALKTNLEKCGFSVELLLNADLNRMLASLDKLASETEATDAVFFHFAGECLQHDGDLWLLPKGARIEKPEDVFAEAVPVARVVESLKKINTPVHIVCLDTILMSDAPANWAQEPDFLFWLSRAQPEAGLRKWPTDLFTKCLADAVSVPGKAVAEIFGAVAAGVRDASQGTQKPEASGTLKSTFQFLHAVRGP